MHPRAPHLPVGVAAFALLAIGIALPACGGPTQSALQSCLQASDQAQTVSFVTTSGEKVTGALLGHGELGIVLAHRMTGNACDWLPYARGHVGNGRSAILFPLGADALGDVVGAAAEIRRQGAAKVVLVGESVGATASLVAADAITPPVAGVVSFSGEASLNWSTVNDNLDALTAVKTLKIPVLFLAASGDDDLAGDARAMYAACPSDHKQLAIFPGTEHGEPILHGASGQKASDLVEKFMESVAEAT